MEDRHYSDDELLDRLYEIPPDDGAHLDRCEACRERWARLTASRKALLEAAPAQALDARLEQQRNRILHRVSQRQPMPAFFSPAPAAALAALLLLAVLLSRPAPPPQPARASNTVSDSQFFAEISAVVESTEPRSAAPIRALFQEKP